MTAIRDLIAAHATVPITHPHDIHQTLAQLRTHTGHTRRTLAATTGFHPSQVRDWETAGKRPNLDSLIRLAGALGYRVALIPTEEP